MADNIKSEDFEREFFLTQMKTDADVNCFFEANRAKLEAYASLPEKTFTFVKGGKTRDVTARCSAEALRKLGASANGWALSE